VEGAALALGTERGGDLVALAGQLEPSHLRAPGLAQLEERGVKVHRAEADRRVPARDRTGHAGRDVVQRPIPGRAQHGAHLLRGERRVRGAQGRCRSAHERGRHAGAAQALILRSVAQQVSIRREHRDAGSEQIRLGLVGGIEVAIARARAVVVEAREPIVAIQRRALGIERAHRQHAIAARRRGHVLRQAVVAHGRHHYDPPLDRAVGEPRGGVVAVGEIGARERQVDDVDPGVVRSPPVAGAIVDAPVEGFRDAGSNPEIVEHLDVHEACLGRDPLRQAGGPAGAEDDAGDVRPMGLGGPASVIGGLTLPSRGVSIVESPCVKSAPPGSGRSATRARDSLPRPGR
jgi:hypothetical protein